MRLRLRSGSFGGRHDCGAGFMSFRGGGGGDGGGGGGRWDVGAAWEPGRGGTCTGREVYVPTGRE